MIELNEDGTRPGPDTVGRVYKICCKGVYSFNVWSRDSLKSEKFPTQADIEKYYTFIEWVSDNLPIEEARKQTRDLNGIESIRPKTIEDDIRVAEYTLAEAKADQKLAKARLDELKKKKEKE